MKLTKGNIQREGHLLFLMIRRFSGVHDCLLLVPLPRWPTCCRASDAIVHKTQPFIRRKHSWHVSLMAPNVLLRIFHIQCFQNIFCRSIQVAWLLSLICIHRPTPVTSPLDQPRSTTQKTDIQIFSSSVWITFRFPFAVVWSISFRQQLAKKKIRTFAPRNRHDSLLIPPIDPIICDQSQSRASRAL